MQTLKLFLTEAQMAQLVSDASAANQNVQDYVVAKCGLPQSEPPTRVPVTFPPELETKAEAPDEPKVERPARTRAGK